MFKKYLPKIVIPLVIAGIIASFSIGIRAMSMLGDIPNQIQTNDMQEKQIIALQSQVNTIQSQVNSQAVEMGTVNANVKVIMAQFEYIKQRMDRLEDKIDQVLSR